MLKDASVTTSQLNSEGLLDQSAMMTNNLSLLTLYKSNMTNISNMSRIELGSVAF